MADASSRIQRAYLDVDPHWRGLAARVAVAVHAGGKHQAAHGVDELHKAQLHHFQHVLYFGDVATVTHQFGLQIRAWPSKYFCGTDSTFGASHSDYEDLIEATGRSNLRGSKSRCIQLRFLYALLELRSTFGPAEVDAYMLMETDVRLYLNAVLELIHHAGQHSSQWSATAYRTGTPHLFSAGALRMLDDHQVMKAVSRSMYYFGSRKENTTSGWFEQCDNLLMQHCSLEQASTTRDFRTCVQQLEVHPLHGRLANDCMLREIARPEHPRPLLVRSQFKKWSSGRQYLAWNQDCLIPDVSHRWYVEGLIHIEMALSPCIQFFKQLAEEEYRFKVVERWITRVAPSSSTDPRSLKHPNFWWWQDKGNCSTLVPRLAIHHANTSTRNHTSESRSTTVRVGTSLGRVSFTRIIQQR